MIEQTLVAYVNDANDEEIELKVTYNQEHGTIEIVVDDYLVCSGDWNGNLQRLFFKAVQSWTSLDDFR